MINTIAIPDPRIYRFPNSNFIFEPLLQNGDDLFDRVRGSVPGYDIDIVIPYDCEVFQILVNGRSFVTPQFDYVKRWIWKLVNGYYN